MEFKIVSFKYPGYRNIERTDGILSTRGILNVILYLFSYVLWININVSMQTILNWVYQRFFTRLFIVSSSIFHGIFSFKWNKNFHLFFFT